MRPVGTICPPGLLRTQTLNVRHRLQRLMLRFALVCAVPVLVGCHADGGPVAATALALQPCRLDGVAFEARCGALTVSEDRSTAVGRRIQIHAAVIPAISSSPLPDPIVVLAGGPGQAAISLAAAAGTILDAARRDRDIVLLDIRGTGRSHALTCGNSGQASVVGGLQAAERAAEDCLQRFGSAVRHYSTPNAAADVHDMLRALGYKRVNLWAVSYGTRLALEIVRQDARIVRSMVLDGAVPATMKLPLYMARDGDLALQAAMRDCEAIPACRRIAPSRQDILDIAARLRRAPVTVATRDRTTGAPTTARIDALTFLSGLRGALYSGEASSLIPLVVREAKQGNFTPLLTLANGPALQAGQSIALGLMLNVVCNEDMPRITAAEVARETAGTVFGVDFYQALAKTCSTWPKGALPAGYYAPPTADVPALILSGGLDPATPPHWGAVLGRELPSARHIVAPNVSHNVSLHGCAPRLLAEFFKRADGRTLDARCLEELSRPAFFIDFAGPLP